METGNRSETERKHALSSLSLISRFKLCNLTNYFTMLFEREFKTLSMNVSLIKDTEARRAVLRGYIKAVE